MYIKKKCPRSLFIILYTLWNVDFLCDTRGRAFLFLTEHLVSVSLPVLSQEKPFLVGSLGSEVEFCFLSLMWGLISCLESHMKTTPPCTASCVTSSNIPPAAVTQEYQRLFALPTPYAAKAYCKVLWSHWELVDTQLSQTFPDGLWMDCGNWSQPFLLYIWVV